MDNNAICLLIANLYIIAGSFKNDIFAPLLLLLGILWLFIFVWSIRQR